jgi:uncharacterized protein YodC (DUF2158 family)
MSTFKPGDVVQLRSGGPKMTVAGPGMTLGQQCYWFSGDELKCADFPPDALVKVHDTTCPASAPAAGTPPP